MQRTVVARRHSGCRLGRGRNGRAIADRHIVYTQAMRAKPPRSSRLNRNKNSLHFAISDVAKMLELSASTLRLWENMGLINPERTAGGYRVYAPEQVERLKYIQRLRIEKKLNVEAIRHLLGTVEQLNQPPNNIPANVASIARQLRRLRQQRKMTLSEASKGSDLSVSFLSSLERGQVHASVATLQKLSVFYETNVLAFFGNPDKAHKHVKPRHRKELSNEPGINIELLALGKNVMEPHLFRIAPGKSSGGSYHHEGEEFIHVVKGCCEIWLDEVERYLLQKGDSLYFSSKQTHRWSNPGSVEAVLLWINTPPTF
jgi:DNA-binding transcriptional MerR regulator/quercetin dioxygenase-like cupin family protein